MVTKLNDNLCAPKNQIARSLPGKLTPSIIYKNNNWIDEKPRKTSLIEKQVVKIRASIRNSLEKREEKNIIKNKKEKLESNKENEKFNDLKCNNYLKTCYDVSLKIPKRCRSLSTPAVYLSESTDRSSMVSNKRSRNSLQALAKFFNRIKSPRRKSLCVVNNSSKQQNACQQSIELAKHLRSLACEDETKPQLIKVLNDEKAYSALKNFLQKEFSVENILFWSAVEKYKTIDSVEKRKEAANIIFETFLIADAQYEINLSHCTKEETVKSMEQSCKNNFDEAQNEIFFLMKSDAFKRFLSTVL